ncbi:arylsulfatase [Muricauda sp. SCSIO 64092]|uniref:arylsulfatase n=1 Tax=Allomuricauda sp. SCSIO 64092 TaxID=2908842 RepID=UPI001FF69628|nr:arylsulfatase [Muricauda sp. SCSIO 64092]UOY04948.1 arylsulfatase [Muricauda sp. SCSIO 64092]
MTAKLCTHIPISFFLILLLNCNTVNQEKEKPNIIYILADDLGYGDLGCYGQEIIKTPNIDELAAQGIRFTNHYAGSTVCAPSRGALMTGLHTGHAYIRMNGKGLELRSNPQDITVGKYLQDVGYHTAMIGKASTGCDTSPGQANDKGFDYFFGYLGHGQAHTYFPKFMHKNKEKINYPENGGEEPWRGRTYSPDLFIEEALGYMEDKKDEPFFLMYASPLPHAQVWAPEEFEKQYKGRFEEDPYTGNHYGTSPRPNTTTAAMVSRLDWEVGKIMKQLEKLGLAENTIVMFSSDNGPHQEGGRKPNFFKSSGPFRGIKRDLYEGGIRVPFIVKWPGVVKAGRTSDHMSAFWDILPTLTDIVDGENPKNSDGFSLLPSLKGSGAQQKAHKYLYWEFKGIDKGKRALRKGNWKLHQFTNIKSGEVRYELYNLADDPAESNNLLKKEKGKADELKALMSKAYSEPELEIFKF